MRQLLLRSVFNFAALIIFIAGGFVTAYVGRLSLEAGLIITLFSIMSWKEFKEEEKK